eukprot:TRINITY_DN9472_c0_g1_i1.p1 TRINITY_DN9472_c0_g1~~TRINITY_DN9472_c0_g1_i1.p1  ORF type:complete len:635 (+),score=192.01 TRINITY_DN9472_c0_g1_i1:256-1905(+)
MVDSPFRKHSFSDDNGVCSENSFFNLGNIGSGSFGDVFKVQAKRDFKIYALKKTKKHFKNQTERQKAHKETATHIQIEKHPNCLQVIHGWDEEGIFFLLTEYCNGGNLKEYIDLFRAKETVMDEEQIWKFTADISQGLLHLHSKGFVHRDIKPENILLCKAEGSDEITLKIGDYGLLLNAEVDSHSDNEEEGDARYLAPEALEDSMDKSSDMFSLGATIFEMASGYTLPQNGPLWHKLRAFGGAMEFLPQSLSVELRELICLLMSSHPSQRPSTQDLAGHPRLGRKTDCKMDIQPDIQQDIQPFASRMQDSYFMSPMVSQAPISRQIQKLQFEEDGHDPSCFTSFNTSLNSSISSIQSSSASLTSSLPDHGSGTLGRNRRRTLSFNGSPRSKSMPLEEEPRKAALHAPKRKYHLPMCDEILPETDLDFAITSNSFLSNLENPPNKICQSEDLISGSFTRPMAIPRRSSSTCITNPTSRSPLCFRGLSTSEACVPSLFQLFDFPGGDSSSGGSNDDHDEDEEDDCHRSKRIRRRLQPEYEDDQVMSTANF